MKQKILLYGLFLLIGTEACSINSRKEQVDWSKYNVGTILFEDKAPNSKGANIYHRIIQDAESYIKDQAQTVLATLYNSPKDSIPTVNNIHYTLEDIDGVSAKGGDHGNISIFYSTRHIEKSFEKNPTIF